MTELRKKYLDLDTRPRAVSDHHCYRCLKTIRPGSKYRLVHVIDGGWHALHPADENLYIANAGDCGSHPLGMDCARHIGLEWTHSV
jgi:hypothetical protein